MQPATWEERIAAAWEEFDRLSPEEFLARMADLAEEGPEADGLYERASALDALGDELSAVGLYQRALALGLGPERRRQAVIQLASSLRSVGRAGEAVELLEAELRRAEDQLTDEVRAFLGLALSSAGRPREGLAVVLEALAPHLGRYTRSLTAYAAELREGAVGGRL
ncbi:tetratricopeptide repeat protein [Naasia sp. SYSU D00948]|uniref:tetratricopeptide repeat protein n=1 Tax=Naasia sp. SYSU D00948 TaxID=2817379 RepID=UPI001FEF6C60|nr:tetratricopeptide repeat protein [Naasia sp. SYSU D00948]